MLLLLENRKCMEYFYVNDGKTVWQQLLVLLGKLFVFSQLVALKGLFVPMEKTVLN